MTRTGITLLVIATFALATSTVAAQDADHSRPVDEIVGELLQGQGTDSIRDVDPAEVPPALLEELGDAVMGLMITDEERHEWMDLMMGGEGSERLAEMHRWIAYRYLENDGNLSSAAWGMIVLWIVTVAILAAVVVLAVLLVQTRRRLAKQSHDETLRGSYS